MIVAWVHMTKQVNIGYSSWLEFQKSDPIGQEYNGNENDLSYNLSNVHFVGIRVILIIGFFDNFRRTNNEAVFEINTWNVNGINGSKF